MVIRVRSHRQGNGCLGGSSRRDASGGVLTSYGETVRFTSTDASATLPPSYTFAAADGGAHTFAGVVLRTAGSQTVTAASGGR